jgi:hypothetical protein
LGMDELGVLAVSRLQKTSWSGRRIQRQVHDKSNGIARSVGRDTIGPQPFDISEFLSSASAMAVYGNTIGEIGT